MAAKKKKKRGHYHRGEYTSLKTGQVCKFRSGWEEKYMKYLDSDPTVKLWRYEPFHIDYLSNKRTMKYRKYHPDFFVIYEDGSTKLIEIKQKRKLETAAVRKKTAAGTRWCEEHGATYVLLTEIELKDIGLI